tara:strand:- start:6171 stop:6593 length:423 start_codon:yes stop_codon:yes gene_type:complete
MGKNKYIETPEKMWELFEAYNLELKGKPILQHDFVGKDAESVRREKERPLTFEGFQNYLDDTGLIGVIEQYFENRDGRYSDYVGICSRIKRKIRQDQIEGGMAGIYNPSITQRLNNLTERQDITSKGDKVNLPEWMTTKK